MRMRKSFILTAIAGFMALSAAVSQPVFAASAFCNTAGCTTPGVDLDFQVVIPQLLRLQIGSPSSIDAIVFDMSSTPQLVGDSSPVSGTGGDVAPGEVSVKVLANGGATQVQVNAGVTGGGQGIDCLSGACTGQFIGWDQIQVTDGTFACGVPPVALDNNGSSQTYAANLNGLVNIDCSWRYTYLNTATPINGTYSGRVTYTAIVSP